MISTKTVLVTGASRGIGKSIAELYSRQGWRVIMPKRSELDLASLASVAAWLGSQNETIDVLIAPIEKVSIGAWDRNIAVNLTSPMLLSQGLAPGMRKRSWGRIVNIASIFGFVSREGRAPYTASKTGLIGLTRAAALDWGSEGVLVNAICPGYIETDLTRQNNSKKGIESMCRLLPLRRLGTPDEVARAVYFLGSEQNTFITGQTLVVDGGFTAQ
jgi:3-oxoacyl-[acyl-carrier protein] reductase